MDSIETLKEEIAILKKRMKRLCETSVDISEFQELQEANKLLEAKRDEWMERAGKHLTERVQAEQERDMAIKRMNNTIASWNEQKTEIERLNAALGAANSLDDGQYYAWMPNEENHLESLSCNVMIPAEWIRNLIDESRQQAERERDEAREKLRGVGVEEYYALQSKCREQAVTIRSLEEANAALLQGLRHYAQVDKYQRKRVDAEFGFTDIEEPAILNDAGKNARNLLARYSHQGG